MLGCRSGTNPVYGHYYRSGFFYNGDMMRLEIPYGRDGKLHLDIGERNLSEVVYPNAVRCGNGDDVLKKAVENPLGGVTLDQFLSGAHNILVVVNDATRPTPTAQIYGLIHHRLEGKNVRYISAVGSHRLPTEAEYREMFGKHYDAIKDKITIHESKKDTDMVSYGKSAMGTDIKMSAELSWAERVIILTSIEPHYFAGYTGGRKSLMPGLAAYSTIEQNHKLALNVYAQALALSGNPVHKDMEDIISKIGKKIFAVQVVLDAHRGIYAAFAGDYRLTFEEGVKTALEVFAVGIKEKTDIVITVSPYPTDIDLYQAQKALDNGKYALKKGGIIILVAECRDGIGNETFYRLLSSAGSPQGVLDEIAKVFKLGYHKAAKMAEIMLEAQMWAISSLKPDVLEKIMIRPFKNLQRAVDTALRVKGPDAKILVLMDGNLTIPRVK